MPTLPYYIVDVFADGPFQGNPLAVVLGADDLRAGELQAIAREFNLSETAFPLPSDVADYRVRIFTPASELPFAGHPSVGTAWLLARLSRIPAGRVRQECGAGILPVEVTGDGATLTGGNLVVGEPVPAAPLLAAVGLAADDLAGPPPRVAGAGIDWTYLQVRDDAVARAEPDFAAIRQTPSTGIYVHSWEPAGRAHARGFAADVGEDPATGSAALGLGAYLAATGAVGDGDTDYRIRQGLEMLRPSTLDCRVSVTGGHAVRATVRGRVVQVAVGELQRP